MATDALVQARIEPSIKEKAEKCFDVLGIDTPTAIRMFFVKVAETGKVPILTDEEAEDLYDAKVGEAAYAEYVAGGCKSRPLSELLKKYNLADV
jgi:addiction module RelB/DinJ family antitoxin